MNQEAAVKLGALPTSPAGLQRSRLIDVVELSASKGELEVPALKDVSLALALSNVCWHDASNRQSGEFAVGTVAICRFNQPRSFVLKRDADFAVILLRNAALEQVRQENRPDIGAQLQAHEVLQDHTLRRLMMLLLAEKRDGFQSGSLFLDSIATALASYLVAHYSLSPFVESLSDKGMAPSALRRCIDFMEAHLEGDLRLSQLACEAKLSTSHLIRSFRQSTGKTPHQFLLHRRIERAKVMMRERRASLTEIGLASGFADQHHLSRVFRRVTGMTPSSYRRSL